MTTQVDETIEDIHQALVAGRAVRAHGPYRIQIGNERLEFHPAQIDDPVPTGLQILEAAGARPAIEHLVFQLLTNGLLEELRPDETTDLRTKGVERFLVFRNDRSFRFELDGRIFEWGGTLISGLTLKRLAGVAPATYGVWLEVRGADDRPIADTELIDLSATGVERFFTGIVQTTEG
ncbi:multiubiquitin domain-containing protein [Leptospira interrogans]